MKKRIAVLREKVYNALYDIEFREKYKMHDKDFTRNRKLDFPQLSLMILKGCKNGLKMGIKTFFGEVKSETDTYSTAAFCKARQKINPEAFRELFELTVKTFYEGNFKTFKGYRVFAIDGSDINLPNTPELFKIYGSENFSGKIQVQAQVSCLYDVLNHLIADAYIKPYKTSERDIAQEHIQYLTKNRTEKELILMDRGYPSEKLIKSFENNDLKYVMRCNKDNFFKEIKAVVGNDEEVVRKCKDGTALKLRVIVLTLDSGNQETLLTNIFDEDFDSETFKHLYHLRWKIETEYNILKNNLELENFSGVNPIVIIQDFYSTLFLANTLAFLEVDCEKELKVINSSADLKYEYKINRKNAIAELRENVIMLILADSQHKQRKIINYIEKSLLSCLSPVRPGRSFPRDRKYKALKFHSNQ